jgi:microcin C transport system ATP-binding protein
MSNLLEISDLHVSFGSGAREVHAVRGVSIQISKGESVALVGESGSGKSVTALSVLQLLPYPLASHPGGSVRFQGEELIGAEDSRLRAIRGDRISMIFQEPLTSLNPLHSVEHQINETLILHKNMNRDQARVRVLELMDLVGLDELTDRLGALPHELSGGQRQRVMIAMALANEPDLLIADEPTTAVDVTIQAQILKLLKELQAKLGMALLMITHDLGIVRHMAERVYVMNDGLIVEEGSVGQVLDAPSHDYTKHLMAAEPGGQPEPANSDAPIIMHTDNLRVWYPIKKGVIKSVVGHIKAVDGVTLTVRRGHTLGVVGESGSGKSSLGRALLRLEKSEGGIIFRDQDLQELSTSELRPLRQRMQMVFQDPFGSLSPRLTVGQIVEEGLLVHGRGGTDTDRQDLIAETLKEVGLEADMMGRYPHEFSGGQRQRISIARALVLKPDFIVLDEPTSALDMSVQAQIVDLLRDLQQRNNLAYLFISHDLRVVRALSHEVLVMRNGKVVEQGDADTVFSSPKEAYTRALLDAALNMKADETGVVGR